MGHHTQACTLPAHRPTITVPSLTERPCTTQCAPSTLSEACCTHSEVSWGLLSISYKEGVPLQEHGHTVEDARPAGTEHPWRQGLREHTESMDCGPQAPGWPDPTLF